MDQQDSWDVLSRGANWTIWFTLLLICLSSSLLYENVSRTAKSFLWSLGGSWRPPWLEAQRAQWIQAVEMGLPNAERGQSGIGCLGVGLLPYLQVPDSHLLDKPKWSNRNDMRCLLDRLGLWRETLHHYPWQKLSLWHCSTTWLHATSKSDNRSLLEQPCCHSKWQGWNRSLGLACTWRLSFVKWTLWTTETYDLIIYFAPS